MNKLISSFLLVTLLVLSLVSCKKSEIDSPASEEYHTIKMWFINPEMEKIISKSVNETALNDVNVYFFYADQQSVHAHFYLNAGMSNFTATLPKGDYHIYAIANNGSDMGDALTKDQVKAASISIPNENHISLRGIPMSCYQPLTLSSNTSLPLVLTRKVAKVEVNLSIASSFTGFQINSVQLCNVADEVEYFNQSRAGTVANFAPSIFTSTYKYYIPENAQGVNASITDQKQKGPRNAPAKATYLKVDGQAGEVFVTYCIYLGANNTSDFNIIGNNHYIYDITISGRNDVDTRVTTLKFKAKNFPLDEYTPGETAQGQLELIKTTNPDKNYTLRYEIVSGTGLVWIDGVMWSPNVDYDFMSAPMSTRTATVAYTQDSESDVKLHFVLTDNDGNQYIQPMTTKYGQSDVNNLKLTIEQDLPFEAVPGVHDPVNSNIRYYVTADYPVRSNLKLKVPTQVFAYAKMSDKFGGDETNWFTCNPITLELTIKKGEIKSTVASLTITDVQPNLVAGQTVIEMYGISTQPGFGDGRISTIESDDPNDNTTYVRK